MKLPFQFSSIFFLLLTHQVAGSVNHQDIAYRFAPVHYQDTDNSDYKSEYITAINYDGDWISTNNWDNLGLGEWQSHVYYSVVESCTHYFINYSFFHPRDWTDFPFDTEHENDLEGVLLLVRKSNEGLGTIEGMITIFHRDFYSYKSPNNNLSNGHENIDGHIYYEFYENVNRPMTAQEAKGHGIKAWPQINNFDGSSNQDGIIYYPSKDLAGSPQNGNDRFVRYTLIDIFEPGGFWDRALIEASAPGITFNQWGNFRGDKSGGCGRGWPRCSANSANAPWGWDDHNDGASFRGEYALDPISLFNHYFNGLGDFSLHYKNNKYLESLQALGFDDNSNPIGFPSELSLNALYSKMENQCP